MLSEKYKCDQSGKNKIFLWLSLDNGHFITVTGKMLAARSIMSEIKSESTILLITISMQFGNGRKKLH